MTESAESGLPGGGAEYRVAARDGHWEVAHLERGFKRYVDFWPHEPTLDVTAHALHLLAETGDLGRWLRGDGHRERLMAHFVPLLKRCAVAASDSASLYGALSAIGVMKALAGIPRSERLCSDLGEVDKTVGSVHVATLFEVVPKLLRASTQKSVFVDRPDELLRTVNAIDLGVSVCWNLGLRPEAFGVTFEAVVAFLHECSRKSSPGRRGFSPIPEGDLCSTSTSIVPRIFDRSWHWPEDFDRESIRRFLLGMLLDGGARVFECSRPMLSSTYFLIEALRSMFGNDFRTGLPAAEIEDFLGGCRRKAGFAFSTPPAFRRTIHTTYYGMRIARAIGAEHLIDMPGMAKLARSYLKKRLPPQEGDVRDWRATIEREARARRVSDLLWASNALALRILEMLEESGPARMENLELPEIDLTRADETLGRLEEVGLVERNDDELYACSREARRILFVLKARHAARARTN